MSPKYNNELVYQSDKILGIYLKGFYSVFEGVNDYINMCHVQHLQLFITANSFSFLFQPQRTVLSPWSFSPQSNRQQPDSRLALLEIQIFEVPQCIK